MTRGREFLKGLWDVRWEGLPQDHCYSCEPVSGGTVLVAGQEEEGGAARGTGLEQEGKQASGMQAGDIPTGEVAGEDGQAGLSDGEGSEAGTLASTLSLRSRLSDGSLTF